MNSECATCPLNELTQAIAAVEEQPEIRDKVLCMNMQRTERNVILDGKLRAQ